MAFLGYLLKINGSIFPNRFISIESYQITPNQTQDEDSYRDGDGKLHRNVLPHKVSKFEFNTPVIKESDNRSIQAIIPDTISMSAEYWNPKKGIYETGTFYTPDLQFTIRNIEGNNIYYNPLRLAFIEY